MKINKSYIKQLIRESLNEVERTDPREDPEGVYGVDPTGEQSKEVRQAEMSNEDLLEIVERAISDLQTVASKLANK